MGKTNKSNMSGTKRKIPGTDRIESSAEQSKRSRGSTSAVGSRGKQTVRKNAKSVLNINTELNGSVNSRASSNNNNVINTRNLQLVDLQNNGILTRSKGKINEWVNHKDLCVDQGLDQRDIEQESDIFFKANNWLNLPVGEGAASREDIDHDGVEVDVRESEDEFHDPENNKGDESQDSIANSSSDEEEEQPTPLDNQPISPVMSSIQGKYSKFAKLTKDPQFHSFMDEMLDQKLAQIESKRQIATGTSLLDNNNDKQKGVTQTVRAGVKSPSDSTLYTPALKKLTAGINGKNQADNIINKISNFVDEMRIESSRVSSAEKGTAAKRLVMDEQQPSTSGGAGVGRAPDLPAQQPSGANVDEVDEFRKAQERSDELLIQAEQFKARVSAPKGNNFVTPFNLSGLRDKFITEDGLAPVDEEIQWLRNFDQDDEFFHITCHVDPNLKAKIVRGEYIDLEKLLPKDRLGTMLGGTVNDEHSLFRFGLKEGQPFVAPATDSNQKISNLRKWEQAFRVYAALYSQSNPSRASEIWQYVYVISTTANVHPWENVYYYDCTFRQLMASKPWRNWGKTYTQGWNLAFRGSNNNHSQHTPQHNTAARGNFQKQHDWRDDCCRRFNKGKCPRNSSECRWNHRCTYCGGWNHGIAVCRKKNGNKPGNGSYSHNNTTQSAPPPAKTNVTDKV